jgi:hypothetical protein
MRTAGHWGGAAALADPAEAQTIATGTPLQALDTAERIPAQQH